MNGGYILVVGIGFGLLLIFAQRIVPKHKRMFRGFLATMMVILFFSRDILRTENLIGYVLALVFSFLFWLLIGRYNPVNDKDEIKVYGLND
jgi:predicted membrane protein